MTYFLRFKYVCAEEIDELKDLMGFLEIPKSPIEFENYVSANFEQMFEEE